MVVCDVGYVWVRLSFNWYKMAATTTEICDRHTLSERYYIYHISKVKSTLSFSIVYIGLKPICEYHEIDIHSKWGFLCEHPANTFGRRRTFWLFPSDGPWHTISLPQSSPYVYSRMEWLNQHMIMNDWRHRVCVLVLMYVWWQVLDKIKLCLFSPANDSW